MKRLFLLSVVVMGSVIMLSAGSVHAAAALSMIRDLISTSAPNTAALHTIQFVTGPAIPPSGSIVITPEAGAFTIPASLDYTDIDVAVSSGGPFTDRSLAATASASDDGVAVVTGTSGSITITLNSTTEIPAGNTVRVMIGPNAIVGATGDQTIVNPSAVRSYTIGIATYDQVSSAIGVAATMIAVVDPITITADVAVQSPIRSNGLPSGEIAAGNSVIELSLDTDEYATCRYATTTGVLYSAMTNTFSPTLGTSFYAVVGGHQDNTAYTYYVRCIDTFGNANDDDYLISFNLKATPSDTSSNGVSTGSAGSGGVGSFAGGSPVLYQAGVSLSGWMSPVSTVTILKDGKPGVTAQTKNDGSFQATLSGMERGAYTFLVYGTDSRGRKSASFSATLTLGSGTNNTLSNIVLPPTMEVSATTVKAEDTVTVTGETIPGGVVELLVSPQSKSAGLGDTKKFTATSTQGVPGSNDGSWTISFDARELKKGTYGLKARTIKSEQAKSGYSTTVFLGVGEEPSPDLSVRADINNDGKVNLVDFSIMLSFWGTSDADADINSDTTVNLADFSILLFNWTG